MNPDQDLNPASHKVTIISRSVKSVAEKVVDPTEYTECWPCPPFDIMLNNYVPAG
jgi:hypothetical protein